MFVQVFSGSLQCAAALMNVSLRMLTHAAEREGEKRERGERGEEGEMEEKKDKGVTLQVRI